MKRVIAILLLCGCSARAEDTVPQYFPVSTNRNPVNAVSSFRSRWYGGHLSAMQEPSLLKATNHIDIAAYRFTYLPTWGRPLAVRTVISTNQLYVRKVMLTGSGGYAPGVIGLTQESVTTNGLPRDVSDLIDKTIWNEEFQPTDDRGLDGSEWIIEGVRNGKYRVISLWCPGVYSTNAQHKVFIDLCSKIIGLTGATLENAMLDCQKMNLKKDPMRQGDPNN